MTKNTAGEKDAQVHWLPQVDPDDFDAARRYLALVFRPQDARALTASLKKVPVRKFPAKDVLRASEQPAKPKKEPDVARQLKKIAQGKPLSPVLLVRVPGQARLLVADGYHRVCAAYLHNEDEPVPCKIA